MISRPILFTGPMVQAILDGRKTQTRRLVKPQLIPLVEESERANGRVVLDMLAGEIPCPYGIEKDQLWVKETFRVSTRDDCSCYEPCSCKSGTPIYRASTIDDECKWTPSIYMPRWASRITLEIVSVGVERVQDISEEDALAEGVEYHQAVTARSQFAVLWDSINGKQYPWKKESNPWVWKITFKKL